MNGWASLPLLPTSLVGSYPQPSWLVDVDALRALRVPRTRAPQVWRVPADRLEEAQDDAARLAVDDQERAGLDVVTDGEVRRESYSNHFATALEGVDPMRTAAVLGRGGHEVTVPVVTGPVRRRGPIGVRDVAFVRARTGRAVKATLPGPFTMAEQSETTHYGDRRALAMDLADAVREEAAALLEAGADVVQLDEPWLERFPERAFAYGAEVVNRAIEGLPGTIGLHVCFGYGSLIADKPATYTTLAVLADTAAHQVSLEAAQPHLELAPLRVLSDKTVVLGVLDLRDEQVETVATVAERIRRALEQVPPERLALAPDCGMKFLPRHVAYAKLSAMAEAAAIVRAELGERPAGTETKGATAR